MQDYQLSLGYNGQFNALEEACAFFQGKFSKSPAQEYLARRGIKPETIERFRLGYAPNDRGSLLKFLEHYDSNLVFEIGLSGKMEEGNNFSIFRNRLMIPLTDASGQVIGFSGRRLDEEDEPKYLCSKESDVFKKGNYLYGLRESASEIKRQNQVIVVEGAMDLIRLHQEGIKNVLAALGTVMTQAHAGIIEGLIPNGETVLCFDGDEPGRRAKMGGIEILLGRNNVSVIELAENVKDPAGVFEKGEQWDKYSRRRDAFEAYIDEKLKNVNIDSVTQAERFLLQIGKLLSSVPRERSVGYTNHLSARTGISVELIGFAIKRSLQ